MPDIEWNADPIESPPRLPAVPEEPQPGSSASTASAQANKVQSSLGACDACRLRKVTPAYPSLTANGADTIPGALFSK